MDSRQFDALARAVIAAPSRRQLFRLLGGAALSALTAPLSRSHHVAAQETTCQIGKVTVWVSAFIPGDVPGVTLVVPDGPYKGQKMLRNPLIGNVLGYYPGDCFITDNRDFKADPGASARMHSLIEIDVAAETIVGGGMGTQRIGETVEVDCEDGDVECRKTGPTNRMAFSNFQVKSGFDGERIFSVDLKAAGQDWCFEWSPQTLVCDIDYRGTFSILVNKARDQAYVGFAGDLDEFPAYEVYAAADGQPAVTLVRESPLPGKTPFALCNTPISSAAPPPRHVTGAATLRCKVGERAAGLYRTDTPVLGENSWYWSDLTNHVVVPQVPIFRIEITVDPTTNRILSGTLAIEAIDPGASERCADCVVWTKKEGAVNLQQAGVLGADPAFIPFEGTATSRTADGTSSEGPTPMPNFHGVFDAGRLVLCPGERFNSNAQDLHQECVANAHAVLEPVAETPA